MHLCISGVSMNGFQVFDATPSVEEGKSASLKLTYLSVDGEVGVHLCVCVCWCCVLCIVCLVCLWCVLVCVRM